MKNNITELVFIIDMSGSMQGLEADTIGGFNSMLSKQRAEAGKCYVSTVLFNHLTKVIHDRIEIGEVKLMKSCDYVVNGNTALIDALAGSIKHISNVHRYINKEDVPKNTMFVVITDGMENASHRYDIRTLKTMIKEKRELGWKFIFIGANIDALEVADDLGFAEEHALNYNADGKGTKILYDSLSIAVSSMRADDEVCYDWCEEIKMDYESREQER